VTAPETPGGRIAAVRDLLYRYGDTTELTRTELAERICEALAIDALLARLTAAEADADRLSVDASLIRRLNAHLDHPEVGIDGVTQMVLDDSQYDLRLHDEVVALRERPS
jgi:hypothetical protein